MGTQDRKTIIGRVHKEMIGPGSDIFVPSGPNDQYEIIEGKPLSRYFSGILFPKKEERSFFETGENEFLEEEESFNDEDPNLIQIEKDDTLRKGNETSEDSQSNNEVNTGVNQYFPSVFGLTFCLPKECKEIDLELSFGTYQKTDFSEIGIEYSGKDSELINQFGFNKWVILDEDNILRLKRDPKNDHQEINNKLKSLRNAEDRKYRYKELTRKLERLLSKRDKYKRVPHIFKTSSFKVQNQSDLKLKDIDSIETLHSNLIKGIRIHTKIMEMNDKNYYKIVVENKAEKPSRDGGSFNSNSMVLSKEALNVSCLFQFNLKVKADKILEYHNRDQKRSAISEEEQQLDFLYRNKQSFAIGHNTSAEWDENNSPSYVKTSFSPEFDVKEQTTKIEDITNFFIIDFSTFTSLNEKEIILKLSDFPEKYREWINEKRAENDGNHIGEENLNNCQEVEKRLNEGIELLKESHDAFKAFKLANSAIYMQMYHTAKYFSKSKGFDLYEWDFGRLPGYEDYENLEFPSKEPPQWRPFQLAFFLINLKSFIKPESSEREIVDLIWFPTGGGKTEAYLAVSAFLIFYRRIFSPNSYNGVNIIMRYTLRLLTSQQFERASKLIFACEKIRKESPEDLGESRISIGFWVGGKMIPNSSDKAQKRLSDVLGRLNKGKRVQNDFQIHTCQWCNTKSITKEKETNNEMKFGFRDGGSKHSIIHGCNNPECDFDFDKGGAPVFLIDDDIYNNRPTLLFGTIDKFAQLTWKEETRNLFNLNYMDDPPELIIQDELHLLSGPLGSMTGLFENLILDLCSEQGKKPKVITSTATVKNVDHQVRNLYGRKVSIFPPQGIEINDTFFSKTSNSSKRKYIGILPTGKTTIMAQLRLLATILYGRSELEEKREKDQYWTLLSYYNSLKDVGKMSNKINSELSPEITHLYNRFFKKKPSNFIKSRELTSRISSGRIKDNLDALEYRRGDQNNPLDLALATNMISVGLDIDRLNLMVINGMPRNIAEYIQSSSRVARKNEGVVFTLLNAENSRDLSVFEHFIPFHQSFYKFVEPLSLTPFTESTFDLLLFNILVGYFRQKLGYYKNEKASQVNKDEIKKEVIESFSKHPELTPDKKKSLEKSMDEILSSWIQRAEEMGKELKFKSNKKEVSLLKTIQEQNAKTTLTAMQSLRNVDPSCKIMINLW